VIGELNICKFFGWNLDCVRNLSVFDYNCSVEIIKNYNKEMEKANKNNKMRKK
jgi:hypothetical protein